MGDSGEAGDAGGLQMPPQKPRVLFFGGAHALPKHRKLIKHALGEAVRVTIILFLFFISASLQGGRMLCPYI